jgi:hypothetical protein
MENVKRKIVKTWIKIFVCVVLIICLLIVKISFPHIFQSIRLIIISLCIILFIINKVIENKINKYK